MKKRTILLAAATLLSAILPVSAQEEMYAARRQALLNSMEDGFAVLFSDAAPGRFNKSFYYLTGIKEPGVSLVLVPGGEVEEALFSASGDWDHASLSPSARAHRMEELPALLSRYTQGRERASVSFGNLAALSGAGRVLSRLSAIENIDLSIAEMRIIKDSHEIEILRRACRITAEGLNDVFRAVEPGMQEEDLAVLLEFGFHMRKSAGSSFLQAASGPNATNVHFGAGERHLEDGDVIVFDVGAYLDNYTADISRTVPVSGHFTREQREIYTVVLNSQKAAIQLMRPGARLSDVRQEAQEVLIDGLVDLGLVLDAGNEAQRRFFIAHGYYHFIGLDIHDVWSEYTRSPGEKIYEPGMIMTMEPGLYFPEDGLDRALVRFGDDAEMRAFLESIRPVYEKYINIGVRIEDDVLITEDGNEILTAAVPKEINEIEAMMAEASPFGQLDNRKRGR
ncbi:aminopeptidase P N-terminal domain-containing protein [Gemmatimonadota bacterium]